MSKSEIIGDILLLCAVAAAFSFWIYSESRLSETIQKKYEPARRAADAEHNALYLKHKSDSLRLEIEIHHQLDSLQKLK